MPVKGESLGKIEAKKKNYTWEEQNFDQRCATACIKSLNHTKLLENGFTRI